ncbi:MAG: FRG domain-containing protein [Geobacter sp.]|nr:MAG: FRG domain-containing protein [Geobacter sp.]
MDYFGYWQYFDDDFEWDDAGQLVLPDLSLTRRKFAEIGLSDTEIEAFIRSGYVMAMGDVVIDRFYGGALLSSDSRTRIRVDNFINWYNNSRGEIPVYHASSMSDLQKQVDKWGSKYRKPLLFRGQTKQYLLQRERPNPCLQVPGYGEISLLPSLWRKMQLKHPDSFHDFENLSTFEWTAVVSDMFDVDEIKRRIDKINSEGGWIYSAQDMEDCEDPLLKEYGSICLDMNYGHSFNLATSLCTLLQHYGLYSPVLDLTTDLDVALFFLSHRIEATGTSHSYKFVGDNHRQSVLYVFRQDNTEMNEHAHHRVMNKLKPLRPVRQSCVICKSAPFALNLAADFLVGIIEIDFDITTPGKYLPADLFPDRSEDNFLAALKRHLLHPEYVSEFRHGGETLE